MIRRTDTWWNECFGKIINYSVYSALNHNPLKMDVLPKTFLQIILAAKWLVRPSTSSSNCLTFCVNLILWPQPYRYIIHVLQIAKVLFLEIDIFHDLPILYSDGFMEYIQNANHSSKHFFINKTKLINFATTVCSDKLYMFFSP